MLVTRYVVTNMLMTKITALYFVTNNILKIRSRDLHKSLGFVLVEFFSFSVLERRYKVFHEIISNNLQHQTRDKTIRYRVETGRVSGPRISNYHSPTSFLENIFMDFFKVLLCKIWRMKLRRLLKIPYPGKKIQNARPSPSVFCGKKIQSAALRHLYMFPCFGFF